VRANDLLGKAEAEARRLAAASEHASRLFAALDVDTASVLADRFADLRELAGQSLSGVSERRVLGDMEAFLPQVIEQLQTMTAAVQQLVTAGTPLLELGEKLEGAVPKVN